MIHEYLSSGADNATTGKALALMIGCDIRDITAQVEKERREGRPICADTNGYYLADCKEELDVYCKRLHRRAGEIYKTRRALLKVLEQYKQKREAQEENDK